MTFQDNIIAGAQGELTFGGELWNSSSAYSPEIWVAKTRKTTGDRDANGMMICSVFLLPVIRF